MRKLDKNLNVFFSLSKKPAQVKYAADNLFIITRKRIFKKLFSAERTERFKEAQAFLRLYRVEKQDS
jgi:hypothetical protein